MITNIISGKNYKKKERKKRREGKALCVHGERDRVREWVRESDDFAKIQYGI